MSHRFAVAIVIGAVITAGAFHAPTAPAQQATQAFPTKPVRFVVPFPPGGSSDIMGRIPAMKLTERWNQQVVIDNRVGGNSIVGARAVASAPPDGYTMLLVTFFYLTVPSLYPSIPYDPFRDFRGVASIAKSRYVLVTNLQLPVNTAGELLALARSKPGGLTYASAGVGGGVHLATAILNGITGTKMLHVPYKGAGPAMQDLIGGRVDLSLQTAAVAIPLVTAGRLKALAVSGDTRFPALPQVPNFAEAGVPDFGVQGWFGIVVPFKTPEAIVDKIGKDMAAVIDSADVRGQLAKQGMEPFVSTPAQVDALIKADIGRYAKVIREEGIKAED